MSKMDSLVVGSHRPLSATSLWLEVFLKHFGIRLHLGWKGAPTIPAKEAAVGSIQDRVCPHFRDIWSTPYWVFLVEDNPYGYPQFSLLIATHDHFLLCRRFSELRARILLLKQDRLSYLECQLRKTDRQETEPLRLGSCRADDCSVRGSILLQIDEALADYGECKLICVDHL